MYNVHTLEVTSRNSNQATLETQKRDIKFGLNITAMKYEYEP